MKLFEMSSRADSVHHSIDTVPDEKNFPLHAHKHCEIFYFIAGKGIYTVEGRDYPLSPGAILLFREGETHKLHISETEPYERIAVHLDLTAPYWGSAEYASLRALFSDRTPGCGNLFLPTGAHAEFAESIFTRLCLPEESEAGFRTRLSALLPALLLELATLRSPAPAAGAPQQGRADRCRHCGLHQPQPAHALRGGGTGTTLFSQPLLLKPPVPAVGRLLRVGFCGNQAPACGAADDQSGQKRRLCRGRLRVRRLLLFLPPVLPDLRGKPARRKKSGKKPNRG